MAATHTELAAEARPLLRGDEAPRANASRVCRQHQGGTNKHPRVLTGQGGQERRSGAAGARHSQEVPRWERACEFAELLRVLAVLMGCL